MGRDVDDCAKRRLTERREIDYAIRFMRKRGIALSDIPMQLAHHYYVDIDEVNAVIAALQDEARRTKRDEDGRDPVRSVA